MQNLVISAGGTYSPSSTPPEGKVSVGDEHIWIFSSSQEFESFDQEEQEKIKQLLGADPVSCLVIEPSPTQEINKALEKFVNEIVYKTEVVLCGTKNDGSTTFLKADSSKLKEWFQTLT